MSASQASKNRRGKTNSNGTGKDLDQNTTADSKVQQQEKIRKILEHNEKDQNKKDSLPIISSENILSTPHFNAVQTDNRWTVMMKEPKRYSQQRSKNNRHDIYSNK